MDTRTKTGVTKMNPRQNQCSRVRKEKRRFELNLHGGRVRVAPRRFLCPNKASGSQENKS